jgi:hypothetical protein
MLARKKIMRLPNLLPSIFMQIYAQKFYLRKMLNYIKYFKYYIIIIQFSLKFLYFKILKPLFEPKIIFRIHFTTCKDYIKY